LQAYEAYDPPSNIHGALLTQIANEMPKELASTKAARPAPFPDRKTAGFSAKVEPPRDKLSLRWEHPPSLPVLLAWFADAGIWVSEKLNIQPMEEGQGWGIVATEVGMPLEVGSFPYFKAIEEKLKAHPLRTIVCRIPRSAILSVNSSDFKDIVPGKTWRQIPPIVQLSLTLLHEIRLGSASRYYGYLQSLPREHVPIVALWASKILFGEDGLEGSKMLAGTEIERETKRLVKEERSNVSSPAVSY
jgi:hypothetical protein